MKVNGFSKTGNWGTLLSPTAQKEQSKLPKIAVIAKRTWNSHINREAPKRFICNIVIPGLTQCVGVIAVATAFFFLVCVPVGHQVNKPKESIFSQTPDILFLDGLVGGTILAVEVGIWGVLYGAYKLTSSCTRECADLLRTVPEDNENPIVLESIFIKKDP